MLFGSTGLPPLTATKSVLSLSSHFSPFHVHSAFFSFHGLPFVSEDARLYRMRRLFGQA